MHFSRRNQDQMLEFALQATGSTGWMNDALAISVASPPSSDLLGIAVFQNFRRDEADFHFVLIAPRMGRRLIEGYAEVAFNPRFLGLRHLWAHISEANTPAQLAALRAGFVFEHRLRAGFDGLTDAIVMRKTALNAAFAAARHPKPETASAA